MALNTYNSPSVSLGASINNGLTLGQIGALTLGQNNTFTNLNSVANLSFSNDLFNSKIHHQVKKYEIYESPSDVLALSAAWKRMRDAGTSNGRIGRLLDKELFEELSNEDHQRAAEIRDHYSKKIVMWKLMGDKLSKYREDLNIFVHSDGLKFKEDMLGLAYHLPAFYEYDVQLDDVRLQVVSTKVPTKALRDNRTLKPLKRIMFKNKRNALVQYWLQDSETDTAAMIQIDTKNPLEHLWNRIFETSATLDVSGNFNLKKRDNFEYASINQWKLA